MKFDSLLTMHTHSAKQDAIEAIARLPDNVPLDEIIYRLHVLSKVQQGREDIEAGRVMSTDELAREIEAW
jgi:predicted transcriptional regulator